jgi:two-component sensor histidine kinase
MSMGLDDKANMGVLSEQLLGRGAAERLLLREFSHRINNELTSAIGLVSVAASRCDCNEVRATLAVVHDRLQSFARVHHSLQMPDYDTTIDLTAYIDQLCRSTSHSKLESKGIELSLSIYPLRMRSERCWFLGMIVFELITNAARHAFHDDGGVIHLEIRPAGASVHCAITDNGASDANPVRGKGLSIVEALAKALDGIVDMQFGPNGTRTVVIFPHSA